MNLVNFFYHFLFINLIFNIKYVALYIYLGYILYNTKLETNIIIKFV